MSDSSPTEEASSPPNVDPETEKPALQITVKFYMADSKMFTKYYPPKHTIGKIKEEFVELFGIPYENIFLLYNEDVVPDKKKLKKLPVDKYGVLELKLLSTDVNYTIYVENVYKDLTVPDILTVKVETEEEGEKEVVVEIDNFTVEKPNLGGYRHIKTGVKYLHGYTQTGPAPPKVPHWRRNHRDTQTYFMRNRRTECSYATATQMARCDLYIPSVNDKILTAGPYETAEEREKRLDVVGKVRIIQRYYRAWKIRKCLKELSAEYHKRMRLAREREEREKLEDEARRRRDLVSKVFPMTHADFSMLYSMLDRWKKAELERISSTHCGASKIAEFYLVLEREIEILRSIENIRTKVAKDMETKKVLKFFHAIGDPIEWDSEYKNLHIIMDTLETQRGREYFALYRDLCDKTMSKEEKLEVYYRVKTYLEEHECVESEEIINLIDRASELLARGMDKHPYKSLHKRIEAMVLHHFKLSDCNEGVTEHMLKIQEKAMENRLITCQRCGKHKPVNLFTLNARMEKVKVCTACKWLDKVEEPWVDLSPYRYILKLVRNYERLHHAVSSVAFILRDRDIHHIITYIWHGHSALSECSDIYQLRLARWKVNEEWSPWNCILLTVEEAKAHLRITKLDEVYEEEFLNHIFNKHALARKQFWQLSDYDRRFTELAKGDPKLDDDSEYYNPPVHDCLFGPIE